MLWLDVIYRNVALFADYLYRVRNVYVIEVRGGLVLLLVLVLFILVPVLGLLVRVLVGSTVEYYLGNKEYVLVIGELSVECLYINVVAVKGEALVIVSYVGILYGYFRSLYDIRLSYVYRCAVRFDRKLIE